MQPKPIYSKSQFAIWILEDTHVFRKIKHLGQVMSTCSKCAMNRSGLIFVIKAVAPFNANKTKIILF